MKRNKQINTPFISEEYLWNNGSTQKGNVQPLQKNNLTRA
jgi:hypothetical protein